MVQVYVGTVIEFPVRLLGGIVKNNVKLIRTYRGLRRIKILTTYILFLSVGEWRKQCFLRFLVRGIQPKQANPIFVLLSRQFCMKCTTSRCKSWLLWLGFHSPLPFFCCTLKIDVDIVRGTSLTTISLSMVSMVGTTYHHS